MSTVYQPARDGQEAVIEPQSGAIRACTAVEQFADLHEAGRVDETSRFYRDLIPNALPEANEQLAFEVDLDACSGCKACVTACHNMNGLDDGEVWRDVGLLQGGDEVLPVIQHVTTACHHCLDPACLSGCPVLAYEKDPVTGIVRHLDDQCIGCQYCMLKCPYDVPKYNSSKGIVRKCDMCQQRLADGEAPACVQSCPNKAIRITTVKKQSIIEESEANLFLTGAPEPSYTLPATVYRSKRPLPRNMLPADYYVARPQHAHWSLIGMLVITQMAVGAFVTEALLASGWLGGSHIIRVIQPLHLIFALALGGIGMHAAILHLGRPLLAFRAVLGLRTSWLSREILAFGVFAALAATYTALAWLRGWGWQIPVALEQSARIAAAVSGALAVFCSAMIYADTRRPFWNGPATTAKFLLTCGLLGVPISLGVSLIAAWHSADLQATDVLLTFAQPMCRAIIGLAAAKLAFEATIFVRLYDRRFTAHRRTATLLVGQLARVTLARYVVGVFGGIALPFVLLAQLGSSAGVEASALGFVCVLFGSVTLLISGEVMERYLFFRAVVAPKMPGSPAS